MADYWGQVTTLWQGPALVRDYGETDRAIRQQTLALYNVRAGEALQRQLASTEEQMVAMVFVGKFYEFLGHVFFGERGEGFVP